MKCQEDTLTTMGKQLETIQSQLERVESKSLVNRNRENPLVKSIEFISNVWSTKVTNGTVGYFQPTVLHTQFKGCTDEMSRIHVNVA